jgi:hypothetical protein
LQVCQHWLWSAVHPPAADDLISFLKAIPDGRYRRRVRYPQWFLLLVAVLGILSGCRSSRDLEAFARRHREALNEALGLNFKRWPSDATFLYLFNKAHLQEFGDVLQAWMISQIPGGAEGLDQLVCDDKTLRGSAVETEDGSHRFVAQATVYVHGVNYVGGHANQIGAMQAALPVHFARNLLQRVPKAHQGMDTAALRAVFAQEDATGLVERWDDLASSLAVRFPKADEVMQESKEDVPAFRHFPQPHWRKSEAPT